MKTPDQYGTRVKKPNIAIITHPFIGNSAHSTLNNLFLVLGPLANRLILITGSAADCDLSSPDVEVVRFNAKKREFVVSRVFEQACIHIRQLVLLFKLRRDIDVLIFNLGTPFPVPLVFAQACGMQSFIISAQAEAQWIGAIKASGTPQRFGEITRLRVQALCERISYFFSDRLIVHSPSVVDQMGLRRYESKTVIIPQWVLRDSVFDIKAPVHERPDIVGYVGRLSEEKGVLRLIEAASIVVQEQPHVHFVLVGDGHLRNEIQAYIHKNHLTEHVELTGWVRREELSAWLNKCKLVVIPSYSEAHPNVMFEGMACGTPILATRVGSVPDVIEEGKTGFILNDNMPQTIARAVVRVISNPELDQIARDAYGYVREEFTVAKASEAWHEALS